MTTRNFRRTSFSNSKREMNHKLDIAVSFIDVIVESDNVRSAQCGKLMAEIRTLTRVYGNEALQVKLNKVFEIMCETNVNDFQIGYVLEMFKNDIKEYIKTQMNKLNYNRGTFKPINIEKNW